MNKLYELYFIFDAETTDTRRASEIERINTLLTKELSATDVSVVEEGAKKLAYPIKKKLAGYYVSITFNLPFEKCSMIKLIETRMNIDDSVIRWMIVDLADYTNKVAKQSLNKKAVATTHQELNKGKVKKDFIKHIGLKAIDYKNIELLQQYTSPYSKIFGRKRTGNSAKTQRLVTQAIKRARHMALMSFTPKHERVV
jgi:small subunit ribosomal protein S6